MASAHSMAQLLPNCCSINALGNTVVRCLQHTFLEGHFDVPFPASMSWRVEWCLFLICGAFCHEMVESVQTYLEKARIAEDFCSFLLSWSWKKRFCTWVESAPTAVTRLQYCGNHMKKKKKPAAFWIMRCIDQKNRSFILCTNDGINKLDQERFTGILINNSICAFSLSLPCSCLLIRKSLCCDACLNSACSAKQDNGFSSEFKQLL